MKKKENPPKPEKKTLFDFSKPKPKPDKDKEWDELIWLEEMLDDDE